MQLSLDGPPYIHDRYRLTTTGKATHKRVIKALERIRSVDEAFYNMMLGLSCTITPPFDLEDVDNWFSSRELFAPFSGHKGNFSVSIMNPTGNRRNQPVHPDYLPGDMEILSRQSRRMFKQFQEYIITGAMEKTKFIPSAMFEAPFHNFVSRCMEPKDFPTRWKHSGDCLPGAGGLAIGAEGKLFVCSSLNLKPIGDINNGLDTSEIRNQRRNYLDVRNSACHNCWVNRFCPICPAAYKYATEPYVEEMHCDSVRRRTDDFLELYIRATTLAPEQLKSFVAQ